MLLPAVPTRPCDDPSQRGSPMNRHLSRRSFITQAAAAASLAAVRPLGALAQPRAAAAPFKISLAQWSLHRELQKKTLDHLDFAKVTRTVFDIDAVEYVSTFFNSTDAAYLADLNRRA